MFSLPGEGGGVLAGVGGVGPLHPQHLQAGGLGGQDGAAAHSAHLRQGGFNLIDNYKCIVCQ